MDGAESYYVATLTLPSALNWDGGDAFGALTEDLLRRGVDDAEEAGELDVAEGGYSGDGSGFSWGRGYEVASDDIASLLADQ